MMKLGKENALVKRAFCCMIRKVIQTQKCHKDERMALCGVIIPKTTTNYQTTNQGMTS
jgi:hypothetical protein